MSVEYDVIVPGRALLGEGPSWDVDRQRLLWVDFRSSSVNISDITTGDTDTQKFEAVVGAVVPCRDGGLLIANPTGFAHLDELHGEIRLLASVEDDVPLNRMNDGKCDYLGRMWGGTMSTDLSLGAGGLYRLDADLSVHKVLSDVTISNGLAFTPDSRTCYYIDTKLARIDILSLDEAGDLVSRDVLVDLSNYAGSADGMAIDSGGGLWVAFYGSGQVWRFSADGQPDQCIELPATITTSVAFGGDALEILCVTTACGALSDEERERQPLAGSVFGVRTGFQGISEVPFSGNLSNILGN
jgi:sugar lactone lactonase YvrE